MHLVDCYGVSFTNQQFIFWNKSQLLGMSGVFHDATTENKRENNARKHVRSSGHTNFLRAGKVDAKKGKYLMNPRTF
jgi:hypothetical protein